MSTFKEFIIKESYTSTSRHPSVYPGSTEKRFKEYYRSISELKELLAGKPITLDNIIKLYATEFKAPADNVIYDLDINEVYTVREYSRSRDVFGKLEPEEYDELKDDIKKHGIKNYGIIELKRLPNGDVSALLGEGNHRLAIAKELKIKTMPIMFYIR